MKSSLDISGREKLSIRLTSKEDVRVALIGFILLLIYLIGNKLFRRGGRHMDGEDGEDGENDKDG